MAKEPQELKWIENLFPEEGYRRKSMFGGFAYYVDDKVLLLTFESPGDTTHRKKKYPFELWNGCMFPVEHELQDKALKRFPFLVNHPVLPKWLYLPLKTENFDELVSDVLDQALRPNSIWGSFPKERSKSAGKKKKKKSDEVSYEKIDTRRPRMFSDEPAEEKLKQAKKISDLKNLGPMAEKEFAKAGIKTAQKFIELGWKKSLQKMIKVNDKNRHSIFAYALIGALTNKDWNAITEDEKQEARDFVKSFKPQKKQKALRP
jgi:hypothetical protein